ncbi:hypothetical protein [Tannerella forsythia]|nr:hypothetical protein [Tannerella forsythia]
MYKNILKNVPKLGKIFQKYMDKVSGPSDRVAPQKTNDRNRILYLAAT